MDFSLSINESGLAEMSFEKATDGNILNNIYLSLMVKKGSFFQNPDFGSRLHILKKNTDRNEALAVEYCKEALQWLIDTGRASKIDIYTERDRTQNLNRLKLLVEATKADGDVVTFWTFLEVV